MVLVTLVIVALLVAKNWEKLMPVASEITSEDSPGPVAPHGQPEAVEALRDLPGLNDMRQAASDRAAEVDETLSEID